MLLWLFIDCFLYWYYYFFSFICNIHYICVFCVSWVEPRSLGTQSKRRTHWMQRKTTPNSWSSTACDARRVNHRDWGPATRQWLSYNMPIFPCVVKGGDIYWYHVNIFRICFSIQNFQSQASAARVASRAAESIRIPFSSEASQGKPHMHSIIWYGHLWYWGAYGCGSTNKQWFFSRVGWK